MRLLSRYLLRQLAAPFVFALVALTSLMLLSQIAKKFGALVGKGLPWTVVVEVFALSLPFIIAMTLPMAVLIAVLYTFSHLAADNEVTAMRASGISVYQVLRPVFAWGVFMAAFNFLFVDQILPRTNAKLRTLLIDIGRKKPTFELREQVINEIPPSQYFLRASRIDAATGRLRGVAIYDVGGETARRIIYADSGLMAYAEGQKDLSLRLFDGTIHQYRPTQPELFQLTYFSVNDVRVKNVFDQLERNTSESIRGDREMSTCEMLSVIQSARDERADAAQSRTHLLRADLRALLNLPAPPEPPQPPPATGIAGYCRWLEAAGALLLPKTAEAQRPAQGEGREGREGREGQVQLTQKPVNQEPVKQKAVKQKAVKQKPVIQKPAKPKPGAKPVRPGLQPVPRPVPTPGAPQAGQGAVGAVGAGVPALTNWSEVAAARDRAEDAQRRADRYAVEVHKKWSISMACISFVIVGIVMALRFPRGGMGLVIGGGMLVFSIHYVGLTAGESLADRGYIDPWLAMWAPNILLTVLGIIGLVRVSRESGSTRGGDFQEILEGIRHLLRRAVRWRRTTRARAAA